MPRLEKKFKSPKTGREIMIGGRAYQELLHDPKYRNKIPKMRVPKQKVSLKKAKVVSLERNLKSLPRGEKYKAAKLRKEIRASRHSAKGYATRGWAAAAPRRGKEREALMAKCGEQCFLRPDTQSYPVCAALRTGQGCKIDCQGVDAARVRSAQYHDKKVLSRAKALQKQYKCTLATGRRASV
jgi:hypothetical protein